ncbi:MAG: Zn-dependent alcohol dehydrogenase [Gammaproteobacteria bacterium]|nr:Zn-dependent alcohol dehydrogenase [Gammaproteobacteria bacterium]
MSHLDFRAAVLHTPGRPLTVTTVSGGPVKADDVLVRVGAASICHTDLEVLEGQLRYPLPMIPGHEVAGTVAEVGSAVHDLQLGDKVALHWNPHCGRCFYCENGQPILCEPFSAARDAGAHFDGRTRHRIGDTPVHMLMNLGGFAEYCIVDRQSAVKLPQDMPLDCASLLGCGVMTGVGAATHIARVPFGACVAVIGMGAVGLSAVQGARLAGAREIVAIDIDPGKLDLAQRVGATSVVAANRADPIAVVRAASGGRGADVVIEAAGRPASFQMSVELCRPGGQVVWLGKVDVDTSVSFRWGSLMGERRIVRSSYGGTRPSTDFPALARAYLDGRLLLDEMISARIALDDINRGFDALRAGQAVRTVVTFD